MNARPRLLDQLRTLHCVSDVSSSTQMQALPQARVRDGVTGMARYFLPRAPLGPLQMHSHAASLAARP